VVVGGFDGDSVSVGLVWSQLVWFGLPLPFLPRVLLLLGPLLLL
jgi:hypothetical protein